MTAVAYKSGRTQNQAIRVAVIEGRKAYVPPGLFALLHRAAADCVSSESQVAEALRNLLMLTPAEYLSARFLGLEVIVDYEMKDVA